MKMKKIIFKRIILLLVTFIMISTTFAVNMNAEERISIKPKMGKEYLNVLNDIVEEYGICKETTAGENDCSGLAYAELIDFNADGNHELYLFYIDYSSDYGRTKCIEELWYFDGTNAVKSFEMEHESNGAHEQSSEGRTFSQGNDGKVYLIEDGGYMTGAGEYGTDEYYYISVSEFDGTSIKEKATLKELVGYGKRIGDSWELDDKVYYEYELMKEGELITDIIEVEGASADEGNADLNSVYPKTVLDFKNIFSEKRDVIHAGSYIYLSWEINDVEGLMDSLESVGPKYNYTNVTDDFTQDEVEKIAKLIAESLGGKITSIYKLSDGVYYVVITLSDGNNKGAVVKEIRSENERTFKVDKPLNEVMTNEALDDYVKEINSNPNVSIDYSETSDFTDTADYTQYLNKVIDNVDGLTVNDVGKSEIATFIENAVTNISKNIVNSKENKIIITDKDIENSVSSANKAKTEFEKNLSNKNISLNKDLKIIIRIDGTGIDYGKPLQIILDKSVMEKLDNVDSIKILLGNNSHGINITSENLKSLIEQYGSVNIQIENIENNKYNITFADEKGIIVEKLYSAIGFFLPAQSEIATVLVSYNGGNDNWGGQYDKANSAIEFSTKYSGKYEILENDIKIKDIDNLNDNQKQAIMFMVSKGYFDLDNNLFKPIDSLTRYDFTEALVRMFFALDRDVDTSFIDVNKDSRYYAMVASAEKDKIVEGYDDGTFRGDLNISKEEVIALCARTLAEKKGYTYPENLDNYINFIDKDQISDWAKKDIALAVREGLIDGIGTLNPKESIQRSDSTEMLYNLFMLLYETAPSEFVISESKESKESVELEESKDDSFGSAVPVASATVALAAIGIGTAVHIKRKKSK